MSSSSGAISVDLASAAASLATTITSQPSVSVQRTAPRGADNALYAVSHDRAASSLRHRDAETAAFAATFYDVDDDIASGAFFSFPVRASENSVVTYRLYFHSPFWFCRM